MYDITLEVLPETTVETRNIFKTVDTVFYDERFFKDLITENESVQIFWFMLSSKHRFTIFSTWFQ